MAVVDVAGITLGYIAVIGGLLFSLVPLVSHFRNERQKREMEHLERMRALELGRRLPQDEPWLSPAKIGALIGVVVPIGSFVPAWLATQLAGYHETIWIAAAMVGLAAVICGSILAGSSLKKDAASSDAALAKPYIEEDAYDVVSSRG